MKKHLSVFFAALLCICMLAPSFAASAGTPEEQVNAQITGAADYLYSGKTFGATDAMDMLILARAGFDISDSTLDAFVQDVEAQLKANSGKLYYPVVNYDENWNVTGTTDTEELELYAAIIEVYAYLGLDYTNVAGYNLADIMTGCGLTACTGTNYYYYRIITEACDLIDAPQAFVDAVMKNLTALYTMGEGTTFWGAGSASADDLGAFITALAPYQDTYSDYISDATALLEKFYTADGYTNYGTANADSTALALMAYSAIGDYEKADEVYALLCKFESDKTGVFTYSGAENAYATKDALTALGYYLIWTDVEITPDPEEDTTTAYGAEETPTEAEETTKVVNKAEKSSETTKKDKKTTSPQTGNGAAFAALALSAAAGVVLVYRKRK